MLERHGFVRQQVGEYRLEGDGIEWWMVLYRAQSGVYVDNSIREAFGNRLPGCDAIHEEVFGYPISLRLDGARVSLDFHSTVMDEYLTFLRQEHEAKRRRRWWWTYNPIGALFYTPPNFTKVAEQEFPFWHRGGGGVEPRWEISRKGRIPDVAAAITRLWEAHVWPFIEARRTLDAYACDFVQRVEDKWPVSFGIVVLLAQAGYPQHAIAALNPFFDDALLTREEVDAQANDSPDTLEVLGLTRTELIQGRMDAYRENKDHAVKLIERLGLQCSEDRSIG